MLTQTRAVLQKNVRLIARNPRDLFREVGLPIIFLLALASITRLSGNGTLSPAVVHYTGRLLAPLSPTASRTQLFLAPCSPFLANVSALLLPTGLNVTCLPTESAALAAASPALLAALVFDALPPSPTVAYRVRLDPALVSGVDGALNVTSSLPPGAPTSTLPSVYAAHFLPLQSALDAALTAALAQAAGAPPPPQPPALSIQHLPTPAYVRGTQAALLSALVPLYLTFIFSLQVRVLLTSILVEKELRIRVSMRMMGLPELLYYLTWTLTAGLKNVVLITATALVVSASGIWARTALLPMWLFFLAFLLACIAFCFAASAVFSKARTGGALGFTLYLLISLPAYAITQSAAVSPAARGWLALLPPCAFSLGAAVITEAEGAGMGIGWGNWRDASVTPVGMSLAGATGMLLVDAAWLLVLALYLDRVVPVEYGTSEHPLFCLGGRWASSKPPPRASALCTAEAVAGAAPSSRAAAAEAEAVGSMGAPTAQALARAAASAVLAASAQAPLVEAQAQASEGEAALVICDLCKVYDGGAQVRALDGLTVDIHQGQVTVLLGHNGAGKTTLAGILTGLMPASSGDARVFGASVNGNISAVQAQTGLCPQHDVLLDQLTVREHLQLWGGIKLLQGQALSARVEELIEDVGLGEKADALAGTLSGGQRRRLSVAIALVGSPRLLILDEPTSGLDPAARRLIWAAIAKHKAGRVTLLITHFMDEAELLGDRVLLMARGRLRVAGSPLFLKSRLGLGYTLSVEAREGELEGASSAVRLLGERVSSTVLQHCALAQQHSASLPPHAWAFTLPRGSEPAFPRLLAELEACTTPPLSLSISMATLEECFCALEMAVGEEERAREAAQEAALAAASAAAAVGSSSGGAASAEAVHLLLEEPPNASAPAAHLPPLPWLDIRRRALVHGPLEEAQALAAELGQAPVQRLLPRDSFSFFQRQVSTQLWRLFLSASRDWRSLALQCLLPIVSAGTSLLFRLLTLLNSAPAVPPVPIALAPSALLDASRHSLVLPYALAPSATPPNAAWLMQSLAHAALPAGGGLVLGNTSGATGDASDYVDGAWLGGAVVATSTGLTLFYNGSLIHSLPVLLSALNAGALAAALNASLPAPAHPLLSATLDPLPHSVASGGAASAAAAAAIGDALSGFLVGLSAALGFIIIPAVQVAGVVGERESGCKQQQYIMGAGHLSYWASRWLYDMGLFLPPAASTALILTLAGPPGLTAPPSHAAAVLLLLSVYGLASPWPAYAISFAFSKAANAQLWTRLGYTLGTLVLFAASMAFLLPAVLMGDPIPPAGSLLSYIGMLLLPPYALALGLGDISLQCSSALEEGGDAACVWKWGVLGSKLFFLLCSVPLWVSAVLWLERRSVSGGGERMEGGEGCAGWVSSRSSGYRSLPRSDPAATFSDDSVEDADVREERARVLSTPPPAATGIECRALRKEYESRGVRKVAVADATLHLPENAVFGLLGPNGAGKTTLLSMLVSAVTPTSGSCTLAGMDAVASRRAAADVLGYCPQGDALFPLLTAGENLTVYAALNGTPSAHLPALVSAALAALDLTRYAHARAHTLSGGNKRRLSLACALIAAPKCVLLDEPSTGVDPLARRRMAEVVGQAARGRTILLTTHLIEEAELLCSRVGVLVRGRLGCLGTPARLKSLYGSGFKVQVSVAGGAGAAEALRGRLAQEADAGIVREGGAGGSSVWGRLVTFLATPGLRLSAAFGVLEAARSGGQVEEYSIAACSLETVFLRFTRMQEEADEREAPRG